MQFRDYRVNSLAYFKTNKLDTFAYNNFINKRANALHNFLSENEKKLKMLI